jgi:endoglucanase
VTTYDTPQQVNATRTNNSLPVPTRFRDDQLATTEAAYADGSNVGPSDWTAYQEFNVSFTPATRTTPSLAPTSSSAT